KGYRTLQCVKFDRRGRSLWKQAVRLKRPKQRRWRASAWSLTRALGEREAVRRLPPEFRQLLIKGAELPAYTQGWLSLVETACQLWGSGEHWRWSLGADELGQIQHPTLLIWGDGDTHGSLDVARRVRSEIRDATL